jgi:aspartyl-tRNA(Asn)/glutamyl-tRNA(Gln) amidotransferase subunit C
MPISVTEVEKIARLAHLALNPEEKERFSSQLSSILDYAVGLQSVSTGDILPTASVLPPRSVLRADIPHHGLDQEELLRNAPSTGGGQFRVPPVLENNS